MKKIGIAADHAGVGLKAKIKELFKEISFIDFGANTSESVDYPDYAHPLGDAIDKGELSMGIAICGSGNGINMTMNKHTKVRSALCWEKDLAALARQHNDANVLALPARFVTEQKAIEIIRIFIETEFEGGRHQRRIDKIACV